jgi:hypothetical protein
MIIRPLGSGKVIQRGNAKTIRSAAKRGGGQKAGLFVFFDHSTPVGGTIKKASLRAADPDVLSRIKTMRGHLDKADQALTEAIKFAESESYSGQTLAQLRKAQQGFDMINSAVNKIR